MTINPRLHRLGSFDGRGNFTSAVRAGAFRAGRDQEVQSCEFMGTRYNVQQTIDNVRFSRRVAEPRVYLTSRLIAVIQPLATASHLLEGQSVSVRLTRIRLGGDFPRIDCELVKAAEDRTPAIPKPANVAANPLQELTAALEKAEAPEQLADVHGKLLKARQRGQAGAVPLLDAWQHKAAPLVEFYCRAVQVGWTRQSVGQYAVMRNLALKLGATAARTFPAKYEGDPARLERTEQWTLTEIEAWSLRHNPFHGQGNLDKLLEACAAPGEHPALAEWLRHLTSDPAGKALLAQYPFWQAVPDALPALIAYFKAVLARLG